MYESPINIFVNDIVNRLEEEQESCVMEYIRDIRVDVDKDELIKALQYDRNQYEKGYNDGFNASRWIPCSDRLPEETVSVLVYAERNAYNEKGTFRKKVIDIGWHVDGRWHIDGCNGVECIAWMPLPEPYAESE